MKRGELLRHLRKYGCYLKREGAAHSLWCNPQTGQVAFWNVNFLPMNIYPLVAATVAALEWRLPLLATDYWLLLPRE
jgi:hypothetical protein